jgi:general secretion pathway protein A
MSYLDHFGLAREPFSNAPNAQFYFNTVQHDRALTRLLYSIDSDKGLAVLCGGIGTGKTTLARRLLDSLPDDRYESSLLVMLHSGVTPEWILSRISMQLGVERPAEDRLVLLRQLYERLLAIEASGRRAVVLIDEAQMLQTRGLVEEFRGLLNLELPQKKLLNIVFFGLPELEDCLQLDEPLAQRVAIKVHLQSLDPEITRAYILHRLRIAGAKKMLFTEDSIPAIHRYAGGVPRLINTICDNCLFEAYMLKLSGANAKMVYAVAGDLGLLQHVPKSSSNVVERDEIDELLERLDPTA